MQAQAKAITARTSAGKERECERERQTDKARDGGRDRNCVLTGGDVGGGGEAEDSD